MSDKYEAVRVLKRWKMHTPKKYKGHMICWEVSIEGIEEPNCDVALLIKGDIFRDYSRKLCDYVTLQHKSKEYKVRKFEPNGMQARIITTNGKYPQ